MWKHADLAPNDSISSSWWMWRFLLHRLLLRPTDERRVSWMERASPNWTRLFLLFVNMDDSLFSFVIVDEIFFVRRFATSSRIGGYSCWPTSGMCIIVVKDETVHIHPLVSNLSCLILSCGNIFPFICHFSAP